MSNEEDIAASLANAIGENDEEATVRDFLDTGYPELNYAMSNEWNGGVAVGRICEISGPPSAGKTAISTAIMADAQRKGGISGFSDHERSFSMVLAPNLGLNIKPGRFIYKKPETFESSLQLCVAAATHIRTKGLIAPTAPIAWVFDSLASMTPYDIIYDAKGALKDITHRNMRDQMALALAISAHMPAFVSYVEKLNICAIFLNQIRTKPGVVYGDPRYTPGGNTKEFYFSQRMMLGAVMVKNDKTKEVIGSQVTGNMIKNKVTRPFRTATWRFDFNLDGSGRFNRYRSMIDFLKREGQLKSAGSYIEWKGTKHYAAPLAEKLEAENAWDELLALLPAKYEPPVVPIVEPEMEED
jgi:protein RecA